MSSVNNYSDYFKCDLHIHTDESNKTKNNDYKGNFSVKDIVDKISEPQNDIKMFSFTDHNIINVEAYEEYYNNYNNSERLLLVGIELDIMHENYLYEKIKSSINNTEYDKDKYHSLIIFKSNKAKELNDKLNNMYKDISNEYKNKFNETIDLNTTHIKYRFTSMEKIVTYFMDEDYLIITHGKKDSNIVDAYKKYDGGILEAQVMVLLGFINAVEMSAGYKTKTIEQFNVGFQKVLSDDFTAKKEVPYVVFSDNHNIASYPKHDSAQKIIKPFFTWIKGDLSFETLRLAFVDPLSRIHVSTEGPSIPDKYLEEIKFDTLNGDKKTPHSISLSPGINTIIGGRSSGKSLLFNAILNTLNNGKEISKIDDYTKDNNKILDIESVNSKLNCDTEYKNDNICDLYAYTQEQIIHMFENNGVGLKDKLDFEKIDSEELNNKINEYNNTIDNFTNYYSDLLKVKNDYQSNISINVLQNSSKHVEEKYVVDDIVSKLKESRTYVIDDIITNIKKLENALDSVDSIEKLKLGSESQFSDDEMKIIDEYKKLLNAKLILNKGIYKKVFIHNRFIYYLYNDLSEIANKYKDTEATIIDNAKKIVQKEVSKIANYFSIKLNYKKYANELENKKIEIKERNSKISENYILSTKVENKVDINLLNKLLSEKINAYDSTLSLEKNFNKLIEGTAKVSRRSNDSESIGWLFSFVKNEINNTLTPKYLIIEKDKNTTISSDYMSQGKKASIYLEIILEKCKNEDAIIMIDQPEDNIDNEFITDVLIDKIRDLRMKNQIILVTHNAAIAINSDSENIIIAQNDDGKISYEPGGLEDIKHRKKVCKLLDGGNYIFDNRYHKYDIINNKLNEPLRKGENNE